MSTICPTVTAYDLHEYRVQLEQILPFVVRVHIDLMDGIFTSVKSPEISSIWLPKGVQSDIHLMYLHPHHQLKKLLKLDPSLVIIQAEANESSIADFIARIKKTKILLGISLLAETNPFDLKTAELIKIANHVLIFSGHLGYHGGKAEIKLLNKVKQIKSINPNAEIGWDGGINLQNIKLLAASGIDVLNTGGYIQKDPNPAAAYSELVAELDTN